MTVLGFACFVGFKKFAVALQSFLVLNMTFFWLPYGLPYGAWAVNPSQCLRYFIPHLDWVIQSRIYDCHHMMLNSQSHGFQCWVIANLIASFVCNLCNSFLFPIIAIILPEFSKTAIWFPEWPNTAIIYKLVYDLNRWLKH